MMLISVSSRRVIQVLLFKVGEGINFPPLLKEFERKEYIVTLQISEENIKKSCNVYTAKKITHLNENLGDHNPVELLSHGNPEISMNAVSITAIY